MKDKRAQARLIKEIVVLAVVAGLLVGFTLLRAGGVSRTPEAEVKPLNTEFDTDALQEIKNKDRTYPEVTDEGVGKDDPFQ